MKTTAWLLILFLCSYTGIAQPITIRGTVHTQSDSSVLKGVSVVLKDTKKGVITDDLGNFSITLSLPSTLVYSSLGYISQEISIQNPTTIHIYLKESEGSQLSEVVVTTALGIR